MNTNTTLNHITSCKTAPVRDSYPPPYQKPYLTGISFIAFAVMFFLSSMAFQTMAQTPSATWFSGQGNDTVKTNRIVVINNAVNLKGTLTADSVKAKKITADNASFIQATIGTATINTLTSTTASFQNANINTLNAVNAQLTQAGIGVAQINNLTADSATIQKAVIHSLITDSIKTTANTALVVDSVRATSIVADSVSTKNIIADTLRATTITADTARISGLLKIGTNSLYLGPQTLTTTTDNYLYSDNGNLYIQSPLGKNFNTFINNNNTGKLGIGGDPTFTPSEKLDVLSGNVRVRSLATLASNPALTKIVAVDANGVLQIRDASTIGGGGGSSTAWQLIGNTLTGTPTSPTEFIGSINPYDWIVKTNSIGRMRITASGNVGIGTTSTSVPITPTTKVHIKGDYIPFVGQLKIEGTGTTGITPHAFASFDAITGYQAGILFSQAGAMKWQIKNFNDAGNPQLNSLQIATAAVGTPAVTVLYSNGNVGINRTPELPFKLDVNGTFRAGKNLIGGDIAGGDMIGYNAVPGATVNTCTYADALNNDYASFMKFHQGGFKFFTNNIAGKAPNQITAVESMTILPNGHVGIGATNPSATLQVNGSVHINNYTNPSMFADMTTYVNGPISTFTISGVNQIAIGAPTPLFTNNQTNLQTSLRGNFCAGTSGHLIGSEDASGYGIIGHNAVFFNGAYTYAFHDRASFIQFNNGGFSFFTAPLNTNPIPAGATFAPTERMTIRENGTVAINWLNPPSFLLQVNGATANTTGVWNQFSDIQIKKDTSSFTDGLNIIKQIHTVNFRYNGKTGISDTTSLHVGIIAQQVQNVAPYMINTYTAPLDSTDTVGTELLSFNSGPLLYAAVNAIQELAAKDSVLTARVQRQDSVIQALQQQMTQCCTQGSYKKAGNTTAPNNDSLLADIAQLKKQLQQLEQSLSRCCLDYKPNNNPAPSENNFSNKDSWLEQNIPNPFTQNTTIKYYMPDKATTASIIIYDLQGKEIKKFENLTKGATSVSINGGELYAGMFIYALIVDGKATDSKTMVLTK